MSSFSDPPQPRPSTLTAEEVSAAMVRAHALYFCTAIPGQELRPVTEMQLLEVLQEVYDRRESGATAHLHNQVEHLKAEAATLEATLAKLGDRHEQIEQSERVCRAWSVIKPHIEDTSWYRAAIAVAELDDAVY